MIKRKLRMGMIGGGPGAFIGAIHRRAAVMDHLVEICAGAFSSRPGQSQVTGEELFLHPARVYDDYRDMLRTEAAGTERPDFISIVTPNHLHFPIASLALKQGFHVIMDKPLCINREEAASLRSLVKKSGLLFCLTHTYTGYPMVKEARHQVQTGKLGKLRKIFVEYPQGWLSEAIESDGQKQASWRTDPAQSGAGAMGDIGTHAFNLAEYITGTRVRSIFADTATLVKDRRVEDDGVVLMKFEGGLTGVLIATQVAAGEENNLRIRVYGDKAGLEWSHADPNSLWIRYPDKPAECYRAGADYLSAVAKFNCRTPAGHPEGFIEAFANIYRNFAMSIGAHISGAAGDPLWTDYPGIEDGYRGMMFIERLRESAQAEHHWTDLT